MAQHHPPRSHAIHSRVRSFSRAGGRLRPVQAEALAQLGPRYVVDVPRADAVRTVSPSFRLDPEKVFGHVGQVRPLIVEVGSGSGEALLAHAAAHPGVDYLAVEVWETAIARLVTSIHRQGLHNVRVVPADASPYLRAVTRGAEKADPAEIASNPRSTSVRLRAVTRTRPASEAPSPQPRPRPIPTRKRPTHNRDRGRRSR